LARGVLDPRRRRAITALVHSIVVLCLAVITHAG